MNARLKRRVLFVGLVFGLVAAVAVLGVAAKAVSAAAPTAPKPVAGQVTVSSDTFMPYKRFGDDESLQLYRYEGGAGNPPNSFTYRGGVDGTGTGGSDAFFNTPDLTIGATPMSVVSAQVCMQFKKGASSAATVAVDFGVQDQNGKFTDVLLSVATGDSQQQCRTLTLVKPVMLTNHTHLVTALVMDQFQLIPADQLNVDGVTYTLQPTQKGDIAPGS